MLTNKIYAFCDAGHHIEWNLSKTAAKKQNVKRTKLFKVGVYGYQYNIPTTRQHKMVTDTLSCDKVWKAEQHAVKKVLKDVIKNIKHPCHIVVHTDQLNLVERYNRLQKGNLKQRELGKRDMVFVRNCSKMVDESIHTYELVFVKSTSKSVAKHGIKEKKVQHHLHREVDRAVRNKLRAIKKIKMSQLS